MMDTSCYFHPDSLGNMCRRIRLPEEGRKHLEMPGIDPGTSHMLSERSTI